MKNIITIMLWFIPLLVSAQKKGVNFQTFRNWQEVLLAAKEGHKGIFIDAYATWCEPCKSMDNQVYTDSILARYLDNNFITVKVQMDQTKEDSNDIKNWYKEANILRKKFSINVLPSLIFIRADENLLQRREGYQNAFQLLTVAKAAIDPKQNYYSQLTRYKNGDLQGEDLLTVALSAQINKDSTMAFEIAKQYQITWLDKQNLAKFVNARTLDFLATFYGMLKSSDKLAKYLYMYPELADSAFNSKGYSNRFTDYLIKREMIDPVIKKNGHYKSNLPEWEKLERKIARRYDRNTAYRVIIPAKTRWYEFKKDSINFVKYSIAEQELHGIGLDGRGVNNFVYEVIFKYAKDPVQLNKGKEFMEFIIARNTDDKHHAWIDTYANVLYKLGEKAAAIIEEEKALQMATRVKHQYSVKEYQEVLRKMRNNEPTWLGI